ncbi:MAG TPA: AraC family transcriptional regulator [Pirellulaceae bacterium]|nr:AraC family transcriptional regulator [Pirellulaceae bacterium]
MARTDPSLSETDIRPRNGMTMAVRSDTRVRRDWMPAAPTCPGLARLDVLHLGIGRMPSPFEIVRTKLAGSYFLACFGGEGRVVVDGRPKRCGPGQAFLLPAGTRHRFYTPPQGEWEFCWVKFRDRAERDPFAAAHAPILADFDTEPLRLAITGLLHECRHGQGTFEQERWCDLIDSYVRRFTEPLKTDDRIRTLWQEVNRRLAEPWTSAQLARTVHLSEKQLERLCLRELGRTPRQQLIWLRMHRAAELLADERRKVASIAAEVGYANPFVFSSTFKRCIGWSPSDHAARLRRRPETRETRRR